MGSWKQPEEYKEEQPVEETSAGREVSEPKKGVKRILLVLGIVAAIIGVLTCVAWQFFIDKKEAEILEQPPEELPTVIEDNPEDFWGDVVTFAYTPEELEDLRAWGYTGTEIEEQQALSTPAEDLINESRKLKQEALDTLNNPESEEYQYLYKNTWVSSPAVVIPEYYPELKGDIAFSTKTLNADYEKVPAHGSNLFLKVYLTADSYHFMEVDIARYAQLPDSGNIVVTYTENIIGETMIVSGMRELAVD